MEAAWVCQTSRTSLLVVCGIPLWGPFCHTHLNTDVNLYYFAEMLTQKLPTLYKCIGLNFSFSTICSGDIFFSRSKATVFLWSKSINSISRLSIALNKLCFWINVNTSLFFNLKISVKLHLKFASCQSYTLGTSSNCSHNFAGNCII